MTTYPVRLPSALVIKITAGLVLFFGILCGAHAGGGNTSLVVKSGEAKEICKCGGHWRVDSSGKVWPVSIEVVTPPKSGAVTTRASTGQRKLRSGEAKTVRLTSVVYQSKKGYVGEDSFTYRRVTADPTDPDNGKVYTVAVTVR